MLFYFQSIIQIFHPLFTWMSTQAFPADQEGLEAVPRCQNRCCIHIMDFGAMHIPCFMILCLFFFFLPILSSIVPLPSYYFHDSRHSPSVQMISHLQIRHCMVARSKNGDVLMKDRTCRSLILPIILYQRGLQTVMCCAVPRQ